MIVINPINEKRFEANGIIHARIYQPLVAGENILIVNIYDSKQKLFEYNRFDEFVINGTIYNTVAETVAALLDVIYTDLGYLREEIDKSTELDFFLRVNADGSFSFFGGQINPSKVSVTLDGVGVKLITITDYDITQASHIVTLTPFSLDDVTCVYLGVETDNSGEKYIRINTRSGGALADIFAFFIKVERIKG